MNLPLSLSSPDGVAAAEHYRNQWSNIICDIGDAAGQTSDGSATKTKLVATLGALAAGLVNLLAYHRARDLEFDRDACLRMIGIRLDRLSLELDAAIAGGVQ